MVFILDVNINFNNFNNFTSDEKWELLKNKIVYFQYNDNTYNPLFNMNHLPATLQEYILIFNHYVNKNLIEENKILKKRIQELTSLEKYKKFDSLEPKKRLKVTPEELDKIKELRKEGITISKIAKIYGVSEQTIYNYLKR